MKRLLIDASHILKACLHSAGGAEHATLVDGQVLPSAIDGYQNWLGSLEKTLKTLKMVPAQIVFVKDGKNSKQLRREFLPDYKTRPPGVPGFHDEFLKLQDWAEENLLSYGAVSVSKEGIEADDIIAALSSCLESVIWSGDKDLLACTGDLFYQNELNPDKFFGIAKKHIVVYKTLVGDQSDTIPGAKGFGEKAFIDMVAKYKDDCLDEFLEMLENKTLSDLKEYVADFKPFQKILDNEETVYASYQCARFHHPGWYDLDWRARYPKGDGVFPNWDLKIELITKDKLTPEFVNRFKSQLQQVPWGPSFDIETWSDEESLAWGIANKSQKGPRLDVYGAHMAGFSITTGPNNNLVYYFPVDHLDTENVTLDDMKMLLDCCDPDKPMFVWNAGFELPVVRKHVELRFDRGWLPNVYDALIMKSYVNENTPLGLKFSSSEYLKYRQVSFEEVTAAPTFGDDDDDEVIEEFEPVPTRQMNVMTGAEVVDYGADDVICTGALANLFEIIMKYEGTWNAYELCELAPAYLCAESFLNGQKFDLDRLKELTKENEEKYEEIWAKIKVKLMDLEWTVGDQLDGSCFTERLPGCVFEPAVSLTSTELKRVFQQVTGETLKTNVRTIEKLAGLIAKVEPDLGAALIIDEDEEVEDEEAEQLRRFNNVAEVLFTPNPVLNLGSPIQMQNLLYTAMGFPVRLRGKLTDKMRAKGQVTGNPKGNESAIRHAIMYDATEEQKELLLMLIEAKGLLTDRGLFLKPYVNMPNPKDGMVHPNPGQSRTSSRRFSYSCPNVQQQSQKSPIREVYIPTDEEDLIVSFDEAGQELRHAAVHSQDPEMLSCFIGEDKRDIHSITGRAIMETKGTDISYEEFKKRVSDEDKVVVKHRKSAKTLNFLSQYGGTSKSLAEKLLITEEEAAELMEAKDKTFSRLVTWQEEVNTLHAERGFAITPLGARKHLVLDGSWKDNHELRSGLNFIIQSGSAEQIKLAMAEVWNRKITDRYVCEMKMQIHDELCFTCSREDMVEFCREVHEIMTRPYGGLPIPWESSIAIGRNFGKLSEIDYFDEGKIIEIVNNC